ncbi:hypothetical protein [Alloyangia pacifica]|uniref:hypothetical protein n=1 Tax=Alloyangia pacifica TaxID=311180 RepID=UPI001CFC5CE3|nr:hypothetical protein [Alloyangia pacifica]
MTSDDRKNHAHDVAHPHETRAGPGDAGASDRPVQLPENPEMRGKGRRAILLFVVLAVAALLIIGVFNRAGMP